MALFGTVRSSLQVCKTETLQAAYKLAKENDGAPGIDGVTFRSVESAGRAQLQRAKEASSDVCAATW